VKQVNPKPETVTSPTATLTIVKKQDSRAEESPGTILYSTPSTITYNVVATSSKDSAQDKTEVQPQTQDIQQYYNAGVKIIGEDYITTYQPGEQIIYQANASSVEEQQIQHQECIQEQHEQQECVQQAEAKPTIIPISNLNNLCDVTSSPETSDLYFMLGLLPDFRNLSHDQKRKVKIGILKLIDDAMSS
jgi:hypothetical protein